MKQKKALISFILLIFGGTFLVFNLCVSPVFAQASVSVNSYGADTVSNNINLVSTAPGSSLQDTVIRIINYFLGFLAIIAVVIVMFAGFKWMTAGGNEEKIEGAKKTLRSGLVGLVIILLSWVIVYFVIQAIVNGSGSSGSNTNNNGGGGSTVINGSCQNAICSTLGNDGKYHEDDLGHPCCSGFVCTMGASDTAPLTCQVKTCNNNPSGVCSPNQSACSANETCNNNCVCEAKSCNANGNSNSCSVDVTACGASSICDSTTCKCRACAEGEAGCGGGFGDPCNGNSDPNGTCQPNNDKCDKSRGLSCQDDCICRGAPVIISVSPLGGFCSNNHNKACSSDANCGTGNKCNTDQPNGASGNFISIFGYNFGNGGNTYGQSVVGFNNGIGVDPVTINSACSNSWTNTQIIRAIPNTVGDGPINVTNGEIDPASGIKTSDSSNDEVGLKIPDFLSNTIKRPGLCSLSTTTGQLGQPLTYFGTGLSGAARFGDYSSSYQAVSSQFNVNGQSGLALIPNIDPGQTATFVKSSGGLQSNALAFVKAQEPPTPPSISSFAPTSSAPGGYITIKGSSFGSGHSADNQVTFFNNDTSVEAAYNFPQACLQSVWTDTQVVVKVPKELANGNYLLKIKVGDLSATTASTSPSFFEASSTRPLYPSVCKIEPDRGPHFAPVSLYGEYFNPKSLVGVDSGLANFYQNQTSTGVVNVDSKDGSDILNVTVPELANTGPVQVINQDLNLPGNSLNFLVGACSKNDDCSSSGANSTCCPASSPKAGQCAQTLFDFVHPANSCYANILVSEFDWKFNSGVNCVGLSQADCLAKLAWCGWDATLQACTACASNSSQTACNGIGTDACCWDGSSCIGKGTKTKNSDGTCGVGSDCASHGDADTCKNDGTCCWGGNTTKCTSTALYDRDNSGACLASSCGSVAKNGAACPVGGTCPNSPGSCSNYAGGNIPLGLCSGFGCNVLSECSGNKCFYASTTNKCILGSDTAPTVCSKPTSTMPTEYCNPNYGISATVGRWAINSKADCPDGWSHPVDKSICIQNNSAGDCSFCPDGFTCNGSGNCEINKSVCPTGSTCDLASSSPTYTQCVRNDKPTCECCCDKAKNSGNSNPSCCAGLTCSGTCGSDINVKVEDQKADSGFGHCGGCANIGSTAAAHDAACNCSGTSGKFCKIDNSNPGGYCADCSQLATSTADKSAGQCVDHPESCCLDDRNGACRGGTDSIASGSLLGHCAYYKCDIGASDSCQAKNIFSTTTGFTYTATSTCQSNCVPEVVCKQQNNPTACSAVSACCWDGNANSQSSSTCRVGTQITASGSDKGSCAYYNCDSVHTSVCASTTPLINGLYSSPASCVAACSLPQIGASCQATGYQCQPSICGSPFSCKLDTNNKSDSCGTCCCTPGSTECSSINSALSCLADKGSCSGNDRGLCCGCSSDGDCSAGRVPNPNTGCGLDSCCDSRPKLDDNNAVKAADDLNRLTPEPDSTTVCRNTIIKVPFDSQMDPKSFNSNNFLLLERVASTSDCKFGTTSFLVFDNEINGGNIFQKIYNYLLSLIKKVVHIFAVVWGENSPALASIIDVAPSLYCSIPGVFSVDQTPTTSALIFRPTNFLDADVDYFAVVLGQKNLLNLASSTPGGVISFKGIGFAGSHLGNHTSVDIALMPNADNNSALDACSVYGCNALKDCAGNKCYFDTNLKKCVLGGVDTPKTCSEDADCSNGNFACQIASGQTCGQPVKYYGGPYNSDGSQRDQSGYYRTVKIGSQCWFKDNLNTGAMINSSVSQTASSDISKYCYDNNSDYCTTDGGLYQWDEAMQGTTTAGTQGICPDGWHVPTDAEQNTLDQGLTDSGSTCDPKRNTWGCGAAGDKLKAGGSSGFDGGFTGYYNPLSSSFVHSPNNIFIWSSTADSGDASSAWDRIAVPATATGTIRFNNDKGTALSIRCIQNPSPSIGVCAAKTVLPACEAATASRTVVNSYVWKFKTLPPSSTNGGVCAVDHLVVTPVAHLFNKNTNDLNENDTDATNKTFDTVADRDRVYTGQAVSSNGQILNPVNGYSWNWNFKVGDTRFITTSTVSGLDYNKTLVSVVPGVPEALTTLTGSLNMDAGNRFNVGSGMSTMVPVRIFICNSPWPIFSNPDNWQPFKDNNNLTCVDGKNCSNYNYEFYYCRDGADTSTPDLPALITAPVNHGTASRHVCSNDINKECPNGNSDCSGDGVCVTELLKDSYFFRAP